MQESAITDLYGSLSSDASWASFVIDPQAARTVEETHTSDGFKPHPRAVMKANEQET